MSDQQQDKRYVLMWEKPAPDFLDWGVAVIEPWENPEIYIANLKRKGVKHYITYELAEKVEKWCSTEEV